MLRVDPTTGQKLITTQAADGKQQITYTDAEDKVISNYRMDHNDPTKRLQELDAEGKVVSTYNAETHEFSRTDGTFKFTPDGVELFNGKAYVDNATGDISFSNGVRLSNSSPGAYQASEAAATSASASASSAASALSAKAGNPATISGGDLSACYGAYGNVVAAMNQCLTSGNFAGFAACLAARGALESAIGVIAPKINAMIEASRQGLSGYAQNEVGQNVGSGGHMNTHEAVAAIKARQNGEQPISQSH